MSLDQHIYGSSDWHLPSPSSTPKSAAGPDSTLKTPKTESFPQSHFLDAWSTPRVNWQQTPAQTPTFILSTPIERPSTVHGQKARTPEDPEFHVNHFAVTNLPLPPVEPLRRLSSSPDPPLVNTAGANFRGDNSSRPRPLSMDTSQMQTPPPTRDATSRRLQQNAATDLSTPATVIARTPGLVPSSQGLFNQTPFGFPSLQFSPDMIQFPSTGPMSAPPLPHSRLFWDQPNDANHMDVDMSLASDPFGPAPHKIDGNVNWPTFHTPTSNQMNPQAFQAPHGLSSPGPMSSFATSNAADGPSSRPSSFISTSDGVDPSMLFSFSSPGPSASFNISNPLPPKPIESRQPYETQLRELREQEAARQAKSQHSRTSTNSSAASFEPRPGLQRSNTDSGFRKSRPSSMESRSSGPVTGYNIPRRSSPLKRSSGGSLMAIPEIRRPKTRLVIDESGRARTETVPAEEEETTRRDPRRDAQDLRKQYPGLWADDDSESEDEEPLQSVGLSRNTSFDFPQRRPSKHARNESGELNRSNSFKVLRPASKPSSGVFDKASVDTLRPVRRIADNAHRRFSMMDFPTSFGDNAGSEDQAMQDSPGDALGALKKAVEGRHKQRSANNTLKAHNQRWAQASADLVHGQSISFDPFTNGFSASPADTALTTPSTDRSSRSSENTRCICNGSDDGRAMILCDSCKNWLHMPCVGLNADNTPPVYVCIFCTGQTPIARGGRVRGPMPTPFDSPLTHKSVYRR